jgi:hypothetical protein
MSETSVPDGPRLEPIDWANGDATLAKTWEKEAVFDFDAGYGPVRVVYSPQGHGVGPHFAFHGPVSESGFYSWFVPSADWSDRARFSVDAYAMRIAARVHEAQEPRFRWGSAAILQVTMPDGSTVVAIYQHDHKAKNHRRSGTLTLDGLPGGTREKVEIAKRQAGRNQELRDYVEEVAIAAWQRRKELLEAAEAMRPEAIAANPALADVLAEPDQAPAYEPWDLVVGDEIDTSYGTGPYLVHRQVECQSFYCSACGTAHDLPHDVPPVVCIVARSTKTGGYSYLNDFRKVGGRYIRPWSPCLKTSKAPDELTLIRKADGQDAAPTRTDADAAGERERDRASRTGPQTLQEAGIGTDASEERDDTAAGVEQLASAGLAADRGPGHRSTGTRSRRRQADDKQLTFF